MKPVGFRPTMSLKRLLYLSHRWLGIGMCGVLAMWCVSGVVMMYVGFPELTRDEYYDGLEPLAVDRVNVGLEWPLGLADSEAGIEQLLLTSSAGRPVYLLKLEGGSWMGMYADTGAGVAQLPAEAAVAAAVDFYEAQHSTKAVSGKHLELLHMDQWSVSDGLHPYRPLHRVSIEDGKGTELYVSSLTGQVVRDTHRNERIWNWLGSNLHWIYPVQLREHRGVWEQVIIVLSLAGLVSVITGAIIGLTRLRLKRRYRNGSRSPYQGMTRYHHLLGLLASAVLLTFLLSGLMSVGPWDVFESRSSFSEQRQRYQQQDGISRSAPAYSRAEGIRELIRKDAGFPVKEISWHWIGGESHISLHGSRHEVQHLLAPGETESLEQRIHGGIGNLIPGSSIRDWQLLDRYDLYYYSHHDRHRPLPALRVKFADPESTWFHVDLSTGQILDRLTDRRRLERWIFNGLHTLDFTLLINHRPAWDLVMISLCSGVFVFSVTSVVIAVQYLRRRTRSFGRPTP
ncbi:MAG: PepSY domain-containing protein [Holophagales bacterium]|nr:PepSY domain-containing protein [Holophagales bacterium]MYD24118.1 PepSY domain-containing protein [Holophagales bacterium]MYI32331.1 PepSY domain-containing protein [Holophagales bacterium]